MPALYYEYMIRLVYSSQHAFRHTTKPAVTGTDGASLRAKAADHGKKAQKGKCDTGVFSALFHELIRN